MIPKILGSKQILGSKKTVGSKNMLDPKFVVPKNVGLKKFGSNKMLVENDLNLKQARAELCQAQQS